MKFGKKEDVLFGFILYPLAAKLKIGCQFSSSNGITHFLLGAHPL